MASELAKKVAGTFIAGSALPQAAVLEWMAQECRSGGLAEAVRAFCAEQPEFIDPAHLQVEKIAPESIQCVIPCRLFDHESNNTFLSEVKFRLDPRTGETSRLPESV